DFELWIAGAGGDEPDLRRLIAARELQNRVKLLGFQEDMRPFYDALDGFVLSSLREGLPNVLLEALAMGVPVMATRVAGVEQVITEGETGLLCPIGDVGALTAGLRRLLTDAALRERLARAGRKLAEHELDFGERMRLERAVYDDVLPGDCPGAHTMNEWGQA